MDVSLHHPYHTDISYNFPVKPTAPAGRTCASYGALHDLDTLVSVLFPHSSINRRSQSAGGHSSTSFDTWLPHPSQNLCHIIPQNPSSPPFYGDLYNPQLNTTRSKEHVLFGFGSQIRMQSPQSRTDQRAAALSTSGSMLGTAPMTKKRSTPMHMTDKEKPSLPMNEHTKHLQPSISGRKRRLRNRSETASTRTGGSFGDADIDDPIVKTSSDNDSLTTRQKNLIKSWHENFAQPNTSSKELGETAEALAYLTRAHPTLVNEFISRLNMGTASKEEFVDTPHPDVIRSPTRYKRLRSEASCNIAMANAHLPAPTLALVQNYIATCRRQRSRTDGRRTVNKGPFRCTFGCGYHTARVFDWRRHEETHEPQELWLCSLCYKFNTDSPFMVSRKDKFLRHAREIHSEVEAEKLLDESKVKFTPRGGLKCGVCGEECGNWEDRCRHILTHFEKEQEGKRGKRGSDGGREVRKGNIREPRSISGLTYKESEAD
ncbi:hypothetical protein IAQ61_000155 [Plenodomus lingam]|nr:hypothetical protein IAQ61_000155 [Plenodomus lingam]